ncbi:MAG: RibD family protein [Terriglobales bacterium]
MNEFEVLFDHGESPALQHDAYARYGKLGFPQPPGQRPWIYSNFVQSLDGIVSLKGRHAGGAAISQSQDDRWLMDLLRAHADAVIVGVNTLVEETETGKRERGPVFRIMAPDCRELRQALGRRREMNIIVTGAASLDLGAYRIFDGEYVDAVVVTTRKGAARLAEKKSHPHVRVIASGEDQFVDLPEVMGMLYRDLGIRHLLCEGGPTLYGYMAKAGLIDEKFITVSPVEVGQIVPPEQERTGDDSGNMRPTTFCAPGFVAGQEPHWTWLSCRKIASHQFSRYRRTSS